MTYKKRELLKLLCDRNIIAPSNSLLIELLLIALDHNVITRDDVFRSNNVEKLSKQIDPIEKKRTRGRPRKYPPKQIDPNWIRDPKYDRLCMIRNNPRKVTLTNVETGAVTTYHSLYKAAKSTGRACIYFKRNNGKIVDDMKIEI